MPIPAEWPSGAQARAKKFLSLWSYYRFSRTLSEAAVPYVTAHDSGTPQNPLDSFRGIAFISYWIASLNVLSEGWLELKLSHPSVDPLLTPAHLEVLKRYRHTVFHFQANLDQARMKALEADPEVMAWVMSLSTAYEAYFDPHSEAIDVERIRPWLFETPASAV